MPFSVGAAPQSTGQELRRRERPSTRPRATSSSDSVPSSRYFSSSASSHSATASARWSRAAAAAWRSALGRPGPRRSGAAPRRASTSTTPSKPRLAPIGSVDEHGPRALELGEGREGCVEVGALAVDPVHEGERREGPARRAARHIASVPTFTPSTAETTSTAASRAARQIWPSPWKFGSPGRVDEGDT